MIGRESVGYEPRFDLDLAFGRQAEMWVANVADALANGSAEVKHDALALKTGNVYVEYECFRRGAYRRSGIQTTTADVWVFVLSNSALCIVVATDVLKRAASENWHKRTECTRGSHPTKGVRVPVAWLLANAGKLSSMEGK